MGRGLVFISVSERKKLSQRTSCGFLIASPVKPVYANWGRGSRLDFHLATRVETVGVKSRTKSDRLLQEPRTVTGDVILDLVFDVSAAIIQGRRLYNTHQSFQNAAGDCAVFVVFPAFSADVHRRVIIVSYPGGPAPLPQCYIAHVDSKQSSTNANCGRKNGLLCLSVSTSNTHCARFANLHPHFLALASTRLLSHYFLRDPLTAYSCLPASQPVQSTKTSEVYENPGEETIRAHTTHARIKHCAEEQTTF